MPNIPVRFTIYVSSAGAELVQLETLAEMQEALGIDPIAIDDLVAATVLADADEFIVYQSGVAKACPFSVIDGEISKTLQYSPFAPGQGVVTDGGPFEIQIDSRLNGYTLTGIKAYQPTGGEGSSGSTSIQIERTRGASTVNMLSTALTIPSGEIDSDDGTPPVINASNDDVATGDRIRPVIDSVSTGATGLTIVFQFTKA